MIIKEGNKIVPFGNISVGECVLYKGRYYMRIETTSNANNDVWNAVDIARGRVGYIGLHSDVVPLNTEVVLTW